jgi:hypothetical protein
MKRIRLFVLGLIVVIAAAIVTIWFVQSREVHVDAFAGATPLALGKEVPDGLEFQVTGGVKQIYTFNSGALRLLEKARVRTREISPSGEILGAYIYTGIPLLYILEGVVPAKAKDAVFDRPLDMVVTVYSSSGKEARFSYGELTMVDDSLPVMLAYHREPLMPSKEPEKYTRNKFMTDIKGLSLICPRETDTARYLGDVVRIALTIPPTPDDRLPVMKKGEKLSGEHILCIGADSTETAGVFENVDPLEIDAWFRIGHGRGIKGDAPFTAKGYGLRSFLKTNFPDCGPGDFFMFVGCDGYRSLFSGREIFLTRDGAGMMLIETLNGRPPEDGILLGPINDFFVDRSVRGLSHIAIIRDFQRKVLHRKTR